MCIRDRDIRAFLDKLRRAYKKQGVPLKWMLHTEIGSRGGIHHHLIINRVTDSDLIIRRAWKKGGAQMCIRDRRKGSYMIMELNENEKPCFHQYYLD